MCRSQQTPALLFALVLLWVALSAPATPAWAQPASPDLSGLTIAVWPEHDRPAVLVIYEGTFADSSGVTKTVRIPMPPNAVVNAVAYRNTNGQMLTLPWEVQTTEQGQEIVFETDTANFLAEYYAEIISAPPQRSFRLSLAVPAAAENVQLLLRQPSRAGAIQIEPAMQAAGVDDLGNPQFSADLGPRAAGETIDLAVSYTKDDAEPSLSVPAATTAAAGESAASPTVQSPTWLLLVGGVGAGIIIALLLFGLLRYRQSARTAHMSRQARRRSQRSAAARGKKTPELAAPKSPPVSDRFCPACGHPFAAEDRFCRRCGAARR